MSVLCILDFSTFPGNLNVFHDDGVFWVTFSCIALLVPVIIMGCLRIVSVPAQSDDPSCQPSGVLMESCVFPSLGRALWLSVLRKFFDYQVSVSGQAIFPSDESKQVVL